MKIIEALKEIKRIEEKVEDLNNKISQFSADLDVENPVYPDQRGKISEWLQSVHDSLKEAMRLRISIQKTNLATIVPIELGGQEVKHSILEWIIRRRLYSLKEKAAWDRLTDKNMKEGIFKNTAEQDVVVKIRRYYDPQERDKKTEEFRGEPGIIDRTLEIINATTDIVE
jgi:hypothetical protein